MSYPSLSRFAHCSPLTHPLSGSSRRSSTGLIESADWLDILALGVVVSTAGNVAWWNLAFAAGLIPGLMAQLIGGVK